MLEQKINMMKKYVQNIKPVFEKSIPYTPLFLVFPRAILEFYYNNRLVEDLSYNITYIIDKL